MKNVVILIFSGRKNGNCHDIGEYIKQYYGNGEIYRINDCFMPCHHCDYECLRPDAHCPQLDDSQKAVFDAVINADIAYYVIPNFCGFPAASYFAFNERSVGYFDGDTQVLEAFLAVKKCFVVVSNSEENFSAALYQQVPEKPDVLYLKSGKYRKLSIDGDLMESEEARQDLEAFLAEVDLR